MENAPSTPQKIATKVSQLMAALKIWKATAAKNLTLPSFQFFSAK